MTLGIETHRVEITGLKGINSSVSFSYRLVSNCYSCFSSLLHDTPRHLHLPPGPQFLSAPPTLISLSLTPVPSPPFIRPSDTLSALAQRRATGIQVSMLIHADDTGKVNLRKPVEEQN